MLNNKIILNILLCVLLNNINLFTQNNITASRQNAITLAVSQCSPAVVGINVTETRLGAVRSNNI